MLRITRWETNGGVNLRLEGQIAGPWVDALHHACQDWMARGCRVRLDLADVSFADRAGLALLDSLRQMAVDVTGCTPFLQEQLRLARSTA